MFSQYCFPCFLTGSYIQTPHRKPKPHIKNVNKIILRTLQRTSILLGMKSKACIVAHKAMHVVALLISSPSPIPALWPLRSFSNTQVYSCLRAFALAVLSAKNILSPRKLHGSFFHFI